MTTELILFALASSLWLGLSVLAVALQWQSQYPTLRFLSFIPFGLLVAACTPGLHTVGSHLACWLTISC